MNDINASLNSKLITFTGVVQLLNSFKSSGKTVALCHGVFDLLHPGHLRHLARAKELADLLIVSITADKFVNKGPRRPVFSEALRAEALAHLESVDFVLVTQHPTAIEIISLIEPDYYVKGSDYLDEKSDKTKNIIKEREVVEDHGGKLVFTDELVFSSSNLINQFLPTYSGEVSEWVRQIETKFSNDEIFIWLDKISRLKVLVIGETIIDIYTDCEALGKSAKDPVLCFNKGPSTSFAGGILAIGAHARGLGAETTIITGFNHKDRDTQEIQGLIHKGINIEFIDTHPVPTIKKERLVDSRTSTRVLELYEMEDTPLSPDKDDKFIKIIFDRIKSVDLVIVADYGHGLISDQAIKMLSGSGKFLAVNAQTNAGNRGFNSVTRYPKMDFVALNGNEAQLETRRKYVNIESFITDLQKKTGSQQILVTKGGDGLDIYTNGLHKVHAPALAPFVKDRVGAGDAVLTVTSLLAAVQAPSEIIGFFGNICGAWAVSFIGNEKNLDIGILTRYAKSILA